MSSNNLLPCESQETTQQKSSSGAESVASKPTLPPFREILPANHIDKNPRPFLQNPGEAIGPILQTYRLPFRASKNEIVFMPFTMIKPDNEGIYSSTRKTVHGKTLTYTLNVKQQPERARACGAGARACADRRPVDPPPVVELRVFEGENTKTDITLSYNANFFLFATLEVARPIANGRMHPTPAIPVLTGCPVAGANYLDRPSPAAYFLFPDLSVRHEGWYRLSFNLYEATKDAEDFDIDRPARNTNVEVLTPNPPPKTQESMAWRLEVKSVPFQVYSAKKFPGLSESTEISRIVADQGCRVRIRRDIRMRKRNTTKDEYDGYEEGMRSTDRFTSPDSAYPPPTPTEGQRSASRGSMDGGQFASDAYHRASLPDSAYMSRGFHHAPSAVNHTSSSFGVPPPSLNNAPPMGMPALQRPPLSPAASMLPPVSSRQFAVPLPPARLVDRASQGLGKTRYPQLPNPVAMSHSMAAEASQPQPSPTMHLPALLTDCQPTRLSGTVYDPTRRHWNLPEPSSSTKRSHSPRSDIGQQPLKQGMRPDNLNSISNLNTGNIEADTDPYGGNDNDDDDPYGPHSQGFMEYRRACGRSNRKRVPQLAS